jgi:hypothetical protein
MQFAYRVLHGVNLVCLVNVLFYSGRGDFLKGGQIDMPKKQKKNQMFHEYDPAISELAMKRFLSRKQIFNYKTKRLHRYIMDDIQGTAVLIEAKDLAKKNGVEMWLSYLEKRLLKRLGKALNHTEILGLAFCLSTLWMLTDVDCDGDSDIVPPLIHQLEPDPSYPI